jgi:hypothetical protein
VDPVTRPQGTAEPDAQSDGSDAGGGGGQDEEEAPGASRRGARSAPEVGNQSNLEVAASYLSDRGLQLSLRVIILACAPLMDEHNGSIRAAATQHGGLRLEAARAGRGWLRTVREIAAQLQQPTALSRLRFSLPANPLPTPAPGEPGYGIWECEQCVACQFQKLVMQLVSQRCWTQVLHSDNLPGVFAVVFHEDVEIVKERLAWARCAWNAVVRAQQLLRTPSGLLDLAREHAVQACLRDLAVHRHVLVQDLVQQGEACQWDRKNARWREMIFDVYGGPFHTKAHLEDVFNSVRDATRANKNKRVSRWRAYHAARHAESLKSQLPSLTLDAEHYGRPLLLHHASVRDGVFSPGGHVPVLDLSAFGGPSGRPGQASASGVLPEAPGGAPAHDDGVPVEAMPAEATAGRAARRARASRTAVPHRWRTAGLEAHKRSVAALAALLANSGNDFQHLPEAWCGAPSGQSCIADSGVGGSSGAC